MTNWDELQDATSDGRGAPSTVGPTLAAIPKGGSHVFGPFKSKASAKSSMRSYKERKEANGVTFDGPKQDSQGFYIRATRK